MAWTQFGGHGKASGSALVSSHQDENSRTLESARQDDVRVALNINKSQFKFG